MVTCMNTWLKYYSIFIATLNVTALICHKVPQLLAPLVDPAPGFQ